MQTLVLQATAASAVSTGVTTTANGATIVVGATAPNSHALLRFDTSTILSTDEIVSAQIQAKVSAVGAGIKPDLNLWASEFGAAIDNADYGLASSNVSPIRQQITNAFNPMIPSTAIVGTVYTKYVPTRFMSKGVGAFSDFEIRPNIPTVGATDSLTIHGAGAVSPGDKPTLTVVTMTTAELSGSNPYRYQAVGAESFFGFSREPNEGVAVKACVLLDADSVGLSQNIVNLAGQGLRANRVRPMKSTYGRVEASGPVSFDLTPEKCMQLLTGVLKITNTASLGSGLLKHTLKVAQSNEIASFTCVTKKGAFRMVYPGCKISRLTISIQMDNIVKGSVDFMGLNEWRFDYTSAGLNDEYVVAPAAAYDTIANGLWSYCDGAVTIGGVVGNFVQGFTIEFNNDLRERRGLNGKRTPISHYAQGFSVSVSYSLYFENEIIMRKFLGSSLKGAPMQASKRLEYDAVGVKLSRETTDHMLEISVPKGMYTSVSDPINGEDAIMLNVSMLANYDEATATNVQLDLTTYEAASEFQPRSDLITVQPAES